MTRDEADSPCGGVSLGGLSILVTRYPNRKSLALAIGKPGVEQPVAYFRDERCARLFKLALLHIMWPEKEPAP